MFMSRMMLVAITAATISLPAIEVRLLPREEGEPYPPPCSDCNCFQITRPTTYFGGGPPYDARAPDHFGQGFSFGRASYILWLTPLAHFILQNHAY